MNEQFVTQLALIAGFSILVYVGYLTVRQAKKSRRIGFFGSTAKTIDSYMSSHQANLKEMVAGIEHEVKKTDPQDK